MCERNTEFKKGDILAVKGARVSEFGGKSLNAADDHASLYHNIRDERSKRLTKWFNELMAHGGEASLAKMRCLT
jgi:hypothetical protein